MKLAELVVCEIPPTRQQVFDGLVDLMERLVSYPTEAMSPELELRDELGLDSSDLLYLMMEIEDAVGIAIDPEKGQDISTLGDAAAELHRMLLTETGSTETGGINA